MGRDYSCFLQMHRRQQHPEALSIGVNMESQACPIISWALAMLARDPKIAGTLKTVKSH